MPSQHTHWITEINCTPPHNDPPESKCDYKTDPGSVSSTLWPPVDGVQYYGRGPFQLSWNFNYGPFSQSINPGLDAKNVLL